MGPRSVSSTPPSRAAALCRSNTIRPCDGRAGGEVGCGEKEQAAMNRIQIPSAVACILGIVMAILGGRLPLHQNDLANQTTGDWISYVAHRRWSPDRARRGVRMGPVVAQVGGTATVVLSTRASRDFPRLKNRTPRSRTLRQTPYGAQWVPSRRIPFSPPRTKSGRRVEWLRVLDKDVLNPARSRLRASEFVRIEGET
jgi:hypothetical protein